MIKNYFPTIGLEIHAELKTKSKMFCACKNDPDEEKPNVNICPVCLGHPGALPVLNREAIRQVLRVGVAVGGKLADFTEWDRKNYFYPDIPKGYQISQYKYPLVSGGALAGVAIERIHLEEDTARSTHDTHEKTLIDFNRSGVPLLELVTKPVIRDAAGAVRFARELQLLLRYLAAGDANMEKGEMRVEANVSISPVTQDSSVASTVAGHSDSDESLDLESRTSADFDRAEPTLSRGELAERAICSPRESVGSARQTREHSRPTEEGEATVTLGTKTEVKNLNSFRAVEKAIEYEITRQTSLLDTGGKVIQETRGWDDAKGETYSQRSKESSHDYRYFPEPDIPKMKIPEIAEFSAAMLEKGMPEMPWTKRERFKKDFGMTDKEAAVFVESPGAAAYFEQVVSPFKDDARRVKLSTNYILSDYAGLLKKEFGNDIESNISLIAPGSFAELVSLASAGEISSRGAKDLIPLLMKEKSGKGISVKMLAEKHGLMQKSSVAEIEPAIAKVIAENASVAAEYKKGKLASLQFLIGQAMKETKGAANPAVVKELLIKKLE